MTVLRNLVLQRYYLGLRDPNSKHPSPVHRLFQASAQPTEPSGCQNGDEIKGPPKRQYRNNNVIAISVSSDYAHVKMESRPWYRTRTLLFKRVDVRC